MTINSLSTFSLSILWLLISASQMNATVFLVNSLSEFNSAQSNAAMNDSIIWEDGTYSNVYMNITKDNLFIAAERLGKTVFTGSSRVRVDGDSITLQGFQYIGGDIGTNDVISIYGSYGLYHELNIRGYRSYKYLRIRESSQYVTVSYCNFENRFNLDDQNILSILVDVNQPGYHKIQHCSFKHFDGTGNDMGIEPIRIGLSSQANRISRSLVEYCYFTRCNGDGEIISSKATQNVYRFNTFENNPLAELVLRHGSEAIVYGNFFLNGKGGVRVREGQNHYIYNNYFHEIDDRVIYLQNASSDPIGNIAIAFNTIISCAEVRLGGSGSYKPFNVSFANNIFADPDDDLFDNPTDTETWISNIAFGDLGIPIPASGLTVTDPFLSENSAGFFGLADSSIAIDAAESGYLSLPQFPGMDSIDTDMMFDLMGQARPSSVADKDLGCNEYPHNVMIQPIATEENTGPSYNSSVLSIDDRPLIVDDLFQLFPNPASKQISISLNGDHPRELTIDLFDLQGRRIKSIANEVMVSGEQSMTEDIANLPAGSYTIRVSSKNLGERTNKAQSMIFIKD